MSVARAGAQAPEKVLTVCLGNICRSPTAEAALREAAAIAGLPLQVDSAGTGDWHVGQPPNAQMRAAADAVDLELRGTAQQVTPELLAWADLVLVMDRSNLADVTQLAERAGVHTPVVLFRQFDPEPPGSRSRRYGTDEVPDPYGGAPEDFREVVNICRRTARSLVANWLNDRRGDAKRAPQ